MSDVPERFLQAASSGETAVVASMLRNPDLDSPGKRRGRSREDFVPDGI